MTLFAEIDESKPDKIKIAEADWRFKDVLNLIPSASFGRDSAWRFTLSWQVCVAMSRSLKNNLQVGPNLQKWTEDHYNNVILPAYTMRTQITAPGYDGLYDHQKGDVAFLSLIKRGLLLNGMGSGKTISAFSTVKRLYELGEDVFPVLVACPNSTKVGWQREILKHVWPGLKINVIDGTAVKRRKQLEDEAHVYIINWESIRHHSRLAGYGSIALKRCPECKGLDNSIKASACEAHAKELNAINFKTVIGDEIHRIMDPSSKVSRAFKAATGDAPFRFGLSGTPLASSPGDLYSILNWLWPDVYTSKSDYWDRYLLTAEKSWGGSIVLGLRPEMEEEFFQTLDPFMRRMPKEVILPFLPPKVYIRREVEMGAKQKKAYEQMKKDMLAEVTGGDIVYTTSPLTKLTRLLQFASSYAEVEYRDVWDADNEEMVNKAFVRLTDPSAKLDALMEDLPDYGDESLIIFAVSKQLINLLSARLEKAGIAHGLITGDQDSATRQMHMDAFQEGKIKYILVAIAAGGTGITLTKASTAVFLQRSWSMIENAQAEDRNHRIGSEIYDQITYVDYVTKDTVEEMVFEANAQKSEQLQKILRDADLINMQKFINNELEINYEEKEAA